MTCCTDRSARGLDVAPESGVPPESAVRTLATLACLANGSRAMVPENDTDDIPGPPREKTDPLFPGPIVPPKSAGTDPGFPPPSAPAIAAASPHDVRVSDTLPAAEAALDQPAPAHRGPAARDANSRLDSDPPASRSKARAESIDELIDGLGGEGVLPKKPKSSAPPGAMGNEAQSSAARKPSSPAPAIAPLPAVLIRPDSQPNGHALENQGDRRSDPTVLTALAIKRRSRATPWIAGVMGVLLAVVLLALFRQVRRPGDPIAPATTQSIATAPPRATVTPPIATTQSSVPAIRSAEPIDDKKPNAARYVEPSATPPARSAPPPPQTAPPPSSNGLEDFRKTIRQ